jgi:uncharacterized RDD family membrane protein YckC
MIPKLLPLLLIALIVAIVSPAGASPRDLLATASDDMVVVAHVQPPDKNDTDSTSDHTLIITRKLHKDTRWRKLATLSGRVVSVAACGEDAKILLDTGDWMTIWDDGQAFGPPARGVRLITLAADHDDLWAVGVTTPTPTPTPTTTTDAIAATAPAAPSTVPATMAGSTTQPDAWPATPAVYRFNGAHWSRIIALPAEVRTKDSASLSLAIIDSQPVLATRNAPNGIRVWTGEDGHWSAPEDVHPSRPVINFDVLNAGLPATTWFTAGGPGLLSNAAGDRTLGPDGQAENDPRSATRAAEAIRVFSASGDHLYEQKYEPDGTAMDKPAELAIDLTGPDSQVQNWLAPTLTVIVTMLLFGAARRGGVAELPAGLADTNLELAALLPRFIAGTIDCLPVLLSILYVARQMTLAGTSDDMPTNAQMIPFYVGCGIYLVYVIAAELLFGKTLGKWFFGLQIVGLDGKRPPLVALLVRNLLRLVDLALMWLPLAMVLFSPLRQRVGDLAAGTLVVQTVEPPKPE